MYTPKSFLEGPVKEGLALLPPKMNTRQAACLVTAICLQESGLTHQVQQGGGPAHGLAQMEGGPVSGIAEVLTNRLTKSHAVGVCFSLGINPTRGDVYDALADGNDALDVAFARLLLWPDAESLPLIKVAETQRQKAWSYYVRRWHPGKPRPEHWADNWRAAVTAVLTGDSRVE